MYWNWRIRQLTIHLDNCVIFSIPWMLHVPSQLSDTFVWKRETNFNFIHHYQINAIFIILYFSELFEKNIIFLPCFHQLFYIVITAKENKCCLYAIHMLHICYSILPFRPHSFHFPPNPLRQHTCMVYYNSLINVFFLFFFTWHFQNYVVNAIDPSFEVQTLCKCNFH